MLTFAPSGLLLFIIFVCSSATSIDNTNEAVLVANSASRLKGNGKYKFTSVSTGKTLNFDRSKGLTHLIAQTGGDALQVNFIGNQARLSGANDKCVSAQWSYTCPQALSSDKFGCDFAAVTYACAVGRGPTSGSATLEKTKQWWYILPQVHDASAKAPKSLLNRLKVQWSRKFVSSDKTTLYTTSKVNVQSTLKLVAKLASGKGESKLNTTKKKTISNKKEPSSKPKRCTKSGNFLVSNSNYVKKNPQCREALNKHLAKLRKKGCSKPGSFLHKHPQYTRTNPQCKSKLDAYRKKIKKGKRSTAEFEQRALQQQLVGVPEENLKRRLLTYTADSLELEDWEEHNFDWDEEVESTAVSSESYDDEEENQLNKRGLEKRAPRLAYYIITVDHLLDMETRAISSTQVRSYGRYMSSSLAPWNKSDKRQLWYVDIV